MFGKGSRTRFEETQFEGITVPSKVLDPEGSPGEPYVYLSHKSPSHMWTFVLLVWVLALVFISDLEILSAREMKRLRSQQEGDIGDDRTRVSVYYEALCPDSKDFVVRQLLPTYEEMGDSFVVSLVPYGKATSTVLQNGQKTFQCQHGPKECQANIVHACVDKYIKDEKKSLEAVKCMIEINMGIRDPLVAAKKCLSDGETKVWNSIEQCSSGEEGEELLFMMGKMTHSLNPPPRFIPLITINDSTKNQNLILRNFKKALCLQFSGKGHPACAA